VQPEAASAKSSVSVTSLAAMVVHSFQLDHDAGRAGDQVMRLEQGIDRGFGDEVALLVGEAHSEFARREFGLGQGKVDDLPALGVVDTVPHALGPRWLIGQGFGPAALVAVEPAIASDRRWLAGCRAGAACAARAGGTARQGG
jgi:hypothetical protein